MVEDINLRTRQYAKRQLQWFSKESSDMRIELSGDFKKSDIADRVIRSWQG
jgi:tRNA A37 N6-isopentenylltransferase MiaA